MASSPYMLRQGYGLCSITDIDRADTRWVGEYVHFSHDGVEGSFRVMFISHEDTIVWLHPSVNENSLNIIPGFDSQYCKVISELEYGIERCL